MQDCHCSQLVGNYAGTRKCYITSHHTAVFIEDENRLFLNVLVGTGATRMGLYVHGDVVAWCQEHGFPITYQNQREIGRFHSAEWRVPWRQTVGNAEHLSKTVIVTQITAGAGRMLLTRQDP